MISRYRVDGARIEAWVRERNRRILFRSETRVIRRVRGCASRGHTLVTKTLFRAFEQTRDAWGPRARPRASESSASREFERSFASRDASACRPARARPRDPRRVARSKRGCATEGYERGASSHPGRGARKRSARAYPVDGCVPGHGVLVVSVDERHGADSGGVRRARGSVARRTTKVNSVGPTDRNELFQSFTASLRNWAPAESETPKRAKIRHQSRRFRKT